MHHAPELAGLYAITDEKLLSSNHFGPAIEQALMGGARIIQYRDKSSDHEKRLKQALVIRQLCYEYDALMIINDDIDLASHSNADGVHLGKDDSSLQAARQRLGEDCIIGISCYNDFERARSASSQGADYVAFGAFFPSPTKPEAPRATTELLREARQHLELPVCAIGGITNVNADSLIDAGADMVAVISDVFDRQNIKQAARNIQSLFD